MDQSIALGDVVILEADDSWISKAIALLTDSKVSHAAIIYTENHFIEMGLSGIGVHSFHDDTKGRTAYIRRLSPEKNMQPVLNVAKQYLEAQTKYDMPSLFFLAGLLVYREIRPTAGLNRIANFILRKVCQALDVLVNKIVNPKEAHLMVCSQLVYQCYYDCGGEYQLHIHHGLLQDSLAQDKIKLIDCIDDNAPLQETACNELLARSEEDLAMELCQAFTDSTNEEIDCLTSDQLQGTLGNAKAFIDLVEKLLEKLDIDLPIEALFVTPADLLKNCTNLEDVCVCKLEYDHE